MQTDRSVQEGKGNLSDGREVAAQRPIVASARHGQFRLGSTRSYFMQVSLDKS